MSTGDTHRLDVLHLSEACGGGVRRHLQLIIPELQRRGLANGLWTFSHRAEEDFPAELANWRPQPEFVEFLRLPSPIWPRQFLALRRRLQKLVAEWRPRCLHLHAGWAGLLGRSIAWPTELQVIYSPHAFGLQSGKSWLRRRVLAKLETHLAKKTSVYVLVGPDEWQEAKTLRLPEEKLQLIPNALPVDFAAGLLPREQARMRLVLEPETQAILLPGRLAWQKGGDILLAALSQANFQNARPLFCFCGQGPQKQAWQQQADAAGVGKYVRFMDYMPELRQLLLAFDAAVIPSRYEGLSYALLECLAAGLPLLVSDLKANQLAADCQTFSAGDSSSLAKELPQFLATIKPPKPRKITWTLFEQIAALQDVYAASTAAADGPRIDADE